MDIGRRIKQIIIGTTGVLGISYLSLVGINKLMYDTEKYEGLRYGQFLHSVSRADGIFFGYTEFSRTYENGVAIQDTVVQDRPRFFGYFEYARKNVIDGGKYGKYGDELADLILIDPSGDGLVNLLVIDSLWRTGGGESGLVFHRGHTGEDIGSMFYKADKLLSETKKRFEKYFTSNHKSVSETQ